MRGGYFCIRGQFLCELRRKALAGEPAYTAGLGICASILGVSSYQLDNEERGFSYRYERAASTCALWHPEEVQKPEREGDHKRVFEGGKLTLILRDYGEGEIGEGIICEAYCGGEEDNASGDDTELTDHKGFIPQKCAPTVGNPFKRTFQAVRIACNRELEVLQGLSGYLNRFFWNPVREALS